MQEVFELLNEYKIFYLATVNGDKPRTRPFAIHYINFANPI